LKSITLKPGLKRIGVYTFQKCMQLTHVSFVEGMKEIGEGTFHFCASLESIELKLGLKKIGQYTFHRCVQLTHVSFVDGMNEIGAFSFLDCTSLKTIELKSGLKKIGAHAFDSCTKLLHVSFVDEMDEIGTFSFANCTALKSITLKPTIKKVGSNAFWGCSQLTAIVVPIDDVPSSLDSCQIMASAYQRLIGRIRRDTGASSLSNLLVSRPLTCPETVTYDVSSSADAWAKELFKIRENEYNIARSLLVVMLVLCRNLKWSTLGRVGVPIFRYWFRGTRSFPLDTSL